MSSSPSSIRSQPRLSLHGARREAARLAHYEARKLNNLPTSLYDYHDAQHGREPPDERRARERRDNHRR